MKTGSYSLRNVLRAHRGRAFALALMLFLLGATLLAEDSPFRIARLALFDQYQRSLPRVVRSNPVTVVEIDEKSLSRLGSWPWPRDRMARLIDTINAYQPAAIGLDMYFPEADATSPEVFARRLPEDAADLKKALAALPKHDEVLARSLNAAPTVLGAAGFDFAAESTTQGMRVWPLAVEGGSALAHVRHFPWTLSSLPALQAAAHGQAVLNADLESGVVRRVPLISSIGSTLAPSFEIEMLRVATGGDPIKVVVDEQGIQSVNVADLVVPTQPNGEIWVRFAPMHDSIYVKAVDVLDGHVQPEMLQGKLVMIGLTGMGLLDMRTTPLRELNPGVDIHVQVLESLFDQQFLLRPVWMGWVEAGLLISGCLLMIWSVPRVRPRFAVVEAVILAIVPLSAGFALFYWQGWLFDAATLAICLEIVFVSLLGSTYMEASYRREFAEHELQQAREASAKVAGELAAAKRIQMGSLPDPYTSFPGEKRFELAARLEPAREVGGDLYDFFMVDAHHLFFIVGDVSGKGVPASLFMAVTKALTKSAALYGRNDIGYILSRAQHDIALENHEMLFVTVIAGLLDVETGRLAFCNAGHDAPWLVGADGRIARTDAASGPPLCVMEDFVFPVVQLQMNPGEKLVVVTDGVTEAMNASNDLYGAKRAEQALATNGSAEDCLRHLREDVRSFVADHPPSDDLTMLAVLWHGPGSD